MLRHATWRSGARRGIRSGSDYADDHTRRVSAMGPGCGGIPRPLTGSPSSVTLVRVARRRSIIIFAVAAAATVSTVGSAKALGSASPQQIILKHSDLPGWN